MNKTIAFLFAATLSFAHTSFAEERVEGFGRTCEDFSKVDPSTYIDELVSLNSEINEMLRTKAGDVSALRKEMNSLLDQFSVYHETKLNCL